MATCKILAGVEQILKFPGLFDSVFRGDPTYRSTADGCGIGLSIAQCTSFAHKGTIQVSSMLSKYTTVTVRLPLSAQAAEPA
jgi:signal transduction histidine kinase